MATISRTCEESGLTAGTATGIEAVGLFLADYTSWLWGCGATCIRIEKNVRRIAAAYGYEVDLDIMPKHITVELSDDSGSAGQFTRKIRQCGINFDLNSELSALSWIIADNRLTIADASRKLLSIAEKKYNDGLRILILASLANAAFCRLFGGDAVAMAVVFCATFAGYSVKQILIRWKVDVRVVFFICAFISSALCAGAQLFHWGDTPAVALATSVLYLIPGVPYLNSASDLIDRHYLCSFSRFMDALVLTASLSAGMCLGLSVMNMKMIW